MRVLHDSVPWQRVHTASLIALAAISLTRLAIAGEPAHPDPAALAALAARAASNIELTESDFELWLAQLRPTPAELRWQEIRWLPTFTDGLIQADARQKPLLLWVMNGHPLGCT